MDFYYQLKIRQKDSITGDYWGRSIFKGVITAENSKQARTIIQKDIFEKEINKGDDILLSVMGITSERSYLRDFFKPRTCKQCGIKFDISTTEYYSSSDFCCESCYEQFNHENIDIDKFLQTREMKYINFYDSDPVIYRIFNTISGKNYVGQTIRSFTLRWWEHIKSWVKYCPEDITAFEFSVLEEFTKDEIKNNPKFLNEREQYWIEKYDCLENDYNSLRAVK